MTPEEQAAADAAQDKQIRELASQITQMSKLGYDPMTIRKGVVAGVVDTTSPPTVSVNVSGDETTLITNVRTLNNYTPNVGQTVLVAKQGTEIFLLGAISAANPTSVSTSTDNGWIRATLSNGAHGGNSNGDIYYRRILDHGSWKMQWRGGWTTSGSSTMIDVADALDSDYRPSSRRSMTAARDANGSNVVKIDFNTDGTVVLVGQQTAPNLSVTGNSVSVGNFINVGSHTHSIPFDSDADGDGLFHNHFGVAESGGGFSAGGHDHELTLDSSISVTFPSWVSLNDHIEYFL